MLGRGKNRSIHRAIFSLALLCLAGCDLYNQSIEDFIYYQTGTVLPRDKASVISPAAEPCPDGSFHIRSVFADIVLELDLENDRGYDLRLRALNNGTESGGVRAEQIAPDRVLIRIAGAKPEDVFRIVLQVGSADGYRSFGEIPLPVIYCHAPLSGARELLSFAFGSWPGTIDESAKTVDVTVSPGTVISGITPAVTVSPGADYSPKEPWGSGVSGSFKTYTVTAEDGTSADYVVTVTIAAAPVYSIVVIPSANGTVTAPVSTAMEGATVALTVNPAPGYSLKPETLLANGGAVGISGSGGSYSFVMPGMDVQITAEFVSSAKELLSFDFGSWPGTVNESAKTVNVTVPYGTAISGITPAVTVSAGADYSPKELWGSGVSGGYKNYTVTAEDGTSADYVVTVIITAAPVYTIVVIPSANGTVTASAAAAMAGETITLTVNPAPGYSLKPGTLLANGDAGGVSGSGGSYSFVMPAADVTVTAAFEAMPGQGSISVTFSGVPQDENTDLTGTTGGVLNWAAGNLTLTAPATGVFAGAAYQWYLDGKELAGKTSGSYSAAGSDFTLARHQVTAIITTSTGIVYAKAVVFVVE